MASGGRRAIIVKAGEKIASLVTTPGDYEDWIAAGIKAALPQVRVIDVVRGETLPPLEEASAVVITGSGAMVTVRAPWMEQSAAWLREAVAAKVPVLGICFGHQLLAHALGGEVGYNTRGVEVGTTTIRLTDTAQTDPLFASLPPAFAAQVSHRQSVLRLPRGARLLARSNKDPHQAFAYDRCAWGLQFHPEFDDAIVRHFIAFYREQLEREGESAERLLSEVADSPESASLLARFAALARTCDEAQLSL
jgi:GMP synthase (glutamine-hydrolysing)